MAKAEKKVGEIGFLLPSLQALERGSMVVHGAVLEKVEISPFGPDDYIIYPSLISLCGIKGWGEGGRRVTCKRCLTIMHNRAERP
jgi:hypothetical protein